MQHGTGAPYLIVAPSGSRLPVLLSSPHSGQSYPPEMLAQARLSSDELRALDDGPVDELLARACAAGATLLAATYPRAVVDLNRDECEQDPDSLEDPAAMSGLRATLKARSGLGVVPTRLMGEPIYAARLSSAELRRRIAEAYRPYHRQLAALVADQRRRFGTSLVLDCHSMPTLPAPTRGERPIDVALGDRFGRSCHPHLIEAAERLLAAAGLRVARNRPYAGGHITERYGEPAQGSHALQIELRRCLFMDERSHAPNQGFARLQSLMGELAEVLAATALALPANRAMPTPACPRERALRSA
jgi:N-formylglutamate amidohydrolase